MLNTSGMFPPISEQRRDGTGARVFTASAPRPELVGKRIAFVRCDVWTRGSDQMADILVQRLQTAGAEPFVYYPPRRMRSRFNLTERRYLPLPGKSLIGAMASLFSRSWRQWDYLIADYLPLLCALIARHRDRLIYFAQNDDSEYYRHPLLRRVSQSLYRGVVRRSRVPVLCTSRQLAVRLSTRYGLTPSLIREGEWARLAAIQSVKADDSAVPVRTRRYVVLGIVGRSYAKGADLLQDVCHRLAAVFPGHLEIWLTGQDLSIRIPGARVVQTGTVTLAQMKALYRRADVFLFTSRFENFPSPPFEGMACHCPVVTTPVADYLEDGINALVARNGTASELAKLAVRVLTDPTLRRQLCNQARATVGAARIRAAWATLADDFLVASSREGSGCAKPLLSQEIRSASSPTKRRGGTSSPMTSPASNCNVRRRSIWPSIFSPRP
ncbi:MAG: hypothetical protein FLDDKLPJ_03325 [Phycisphaerae bacterium]|nr:hypothetical protein [Phycisphaerae bacterium]